MILQDVIRRDDPPHAEVVWFDEASGEVFRHGYANSLTGQLRSVLGAEAGRYEALIAELEATCPAPSPAALRQDLVAALSAEYERSMAVISGGYTLSERESWHVQTQEARALLSYEHSLTPWINSAGDDAQALQQIDVRTGWPSQEEYQ